MSPQAKRGLAAAGVTFWQKGGLYPGAGLTGVVLLAFTSHSEAHFLIQVRIHHTEATLTPFLGLDGGRKPKHLSYHLRHMGILTSVRIYYSPSERLQLKAKGLTPWEASVSLGFAFSFSGSVRTHKEKLLLPL